ncbi:MAG: flagellar biosynthesis protein FlhB [Sporolactobacillus sp.]
MSEALDLQFFAGEGEKTEKATPHKRSETRKKGEVFKSVDLSTAVSLLALFVYLRIDGANIGSSLGRMITYYYSHELHLNLTENNVLKLFSDLSVSMMRLLAPLLAVAFVAALASQIAQVGFLFHPELIMFKGQRISPLAGFKRLYSLRAIVELIKSILKIGLVGLIVFSVLWLWRNTVARSAQEPLQQAVGSIAGIMINMGLIASGVLIALSLFDYAYQRFDFEKNLRMSKQDVKDEYKSIEGDPQIKARIRQRQKEMALRRMMQELPKADVVITNPTHFAVALRYEAKTMSAPKVIAKGADQIAFRMKDIARNYKVPIVERPPLARALYAKLEIGDVVPEEFFRAVAEILAYVYRTKGKV